MTSRQFLPATAALGAALAFCIPSASDAQDSFGGAPVQPQGQQQQMPQQGYPQQGPYSGGQQQQMPQQGYPQQGPYPGGPQQQMPQQGYPQQGPYPGGPQQQMPQQGLPQQGPYSDRQQQQMPQQGLPQQGPYSGGPQLDALSAQERQDFGVPATPQLHSGPMHGPTPVSIPGGQLITTKGLVELLQNRQMQVLVLDVLGGPEMIPGAQFAVPAHAPGSFQDGTQQEFGRFLQQATGGNKQYPLVLYCQSPQCWMSYNAALRAINMGYTNVLWYRGGIEFWKNGGQPTQPAPRPY